MLQNWDKYILIGLMIVVLFILTRMNKVMSLQTTLLVGMATKLGVSSDDDDVQIRRPVKKEVEEPQGETEEESNQIIDIAEKIHNGIKLTKKETEFKARFEKEIEEELQECIEDDMKSIAEDIKNGVEITKDDFVFYNGNHARLKEKLELAELVTEDIKIKEAEEPDTNTEKVAPENEHERKHLLLSFFDDGIPRANSQLAVMYAKVTGLVPSTGNTAKILDVLLEEGKLKNKKMLSQSRNKVFYGLPHWFEGNKFIKEYLIKIPK